MSKISVSDYRNKFNIDRMLRDIPNRNPNDMSSSSDNKSSNVEVIKSSNCVINIDYVVQEEKISFEVFRSSIDSCVFRKKFSLRQSKSCTHLTSLDKLQLSNFHLNNKMVQTEGQFRTALLPPDNIGPAPFSRNFECPVKDIPNPNEFSYKETYDVSNFKFPENTAIVKLQNSNFCCLDFDGTRSSKRNYELHRTKNKQTIHVKRVRSDINIKKGRMYSPSPFRALSPSPFREGYPSPFTAGQNIVANSVYEVDKFPETKIESNKQILDAIKHKKKKHRVVENESNTNTIKLKKDEHAAFEFVLSPKDDETNKQIKNDKEKNDHHHKHKHRKIIVTSNTLEPSLLKPKMKDEEQQTNYNDIINLECSSVNELYIKPNFKTISVTNSLNSGDQNLSTKKKKREKKKKMAVSVFPCVDIKGSQHHLEMSVNQKRPSIPRRRIYDSSESRAPESNKTDVQSVLSTIQSIEEDITSITSKRKAIPRRCLKKEENPRDASPAKLPKNENTILKEKITNLFKDDQPTINSDYDKKIEELCGLINSLVQEKERSRSRSPQKLKNTNSPAKSESPTRQNSFKKEPEKTISKVDRLKITHNKKDSVTILDSVDKDTITKQNTVPRTVLQVSPRANEILHSADFKRKNTMVTYPISIMPDELKLEENKINNEVTDAPLAPSNNNKLAQQSLIKKPLSKKPTETKRNCSAVTFSSQIAIIGDDSQLFNDEVNVKNTLFSINENFKRSKTLPTKQEFCKSSSSRNSTLASSGMCELPSSISNSDLNSLPEEKHKERREAKNADKSKKQKPGAIENCTFLSARTNQLTKNVNSSFQKRKEYYLNLKMKMKNKPETSDNEKIIEESTSQTKLAEDKIASNRTFIVTPDPPKLNQRSKSRIPLYKHNSKKEISTKDFILKTKKEPSLFPYEFSARNTPEENILNRSPRNDNSNFPRNTEKLVSPPKIGDVKQQISTFLHSYPLEINSLPNSPRTRAKPKNASLSLKET